MPGRILRGEKREHVVSQVTDILKGWHTSHFEYEGAVRAGLRAALVLEGNRWPLADHEAEQIVAESLRIIGAKRPDWEEGQRRYVDRGSFCARCGGAMPDELVSGGRNRRFCSVSCAEAEMMERDTGILSRQSNARYEAQRIIAREKIESKVCSLCGKRFRAMNPYQQGTQIYCSQACYHASKVTNPEIECLACGKNFRSRKNYKGKLQQFCSPACADGFGRTTSYTVVCECCGLAFVSKRPDARYCSRRCLRFVADWRGGTRVPRRLGDLVFDYLFIAPVATARADRPAPVFLTVGLFDSLFRDAA